MLWSRRELSNIFKPRLSHFPVSLQVENFRNMFDGTDAMKTDLRGWGVDAEARTANMFANSVYPFATAGNQIDANDDTYRFEAPSPGEGEFPILGAGSAHGLMANLSVVVSALLAYIAW